jgi:hypothetical protein
MSSPMTTKIPPTEFAQIVQTNSSPETIAALLNEAEERYTSMPRHFNAKSVYPFWKTCAVCLHPYQCHTREQVTRNLTCSPKCANILNGQRRTGKPQGQRTERKKILCSVCGRELWRRERELARASVPVCGYRCNGILRGREWAQHGHKGRASWTPESEAAIKKRMTGPNNPAWKGGVTYFKTHGNYAGVRYVRCPVEFTSMARRDGYVKEHRLLVAQAIGRPLLRSEVVHHIDHDPKNNSLDNLQLFASNQAHKLFEHRGSPDPIWQL